MNELTLFALNDAPTMNTATTAARALLVGFLLCGFSMIVTRRLSPRVVLVALCVSAGIFTATSARADDYPRQQIGWGNSSGGSTVYPQWQTICQIGVYPDRTYLKQGENYQCWLAANLSPSFQTSATYRGFYAYPVYGCPYGGTLSGGTCISAPSCPLGEQRDPTTGQCVTGPCTAGQSWQVNLGVGYARTANNTDDWINPRFPDFADNGAGCQAAVGDVVPGSCYVTETVGPPYAGYCTFNVTTTGQTSSPEDEAANEALPPIPCPSGTAPGSVNGVGGCFQTSETTTQKETTTNPDGSTTTTETSTGPTGSTTTITTCTGDGACTSTTTHVGGGASSKPPAETGGKYDDGTPDGAGGEEGEGDDPCGLPGLPDCRVKVNEEGTPTETPGMAEAFGQAAQAVDDQFDYLTGMGWVRSELPFTWNPPLPDGSCSALEIRGYSLDICDPIGKARQFWSYCLAVMAGLYIWRSATNANPGA